MPRIKESTRLERRERILRAATSSLLENGLHDTTMADIASRAGLVPASLYVHFPNKQVLVASVARAAMLGKAADLDAPGVPFAPADLVVRLIRTAAQDPARLGVVLQLFGEAGRDEELRSALADAVSEVMEPMFRRSLLHWTAGTDGLASDEEKAKHTARVLLSLTYGFFAQITVLHEFDTESYCQTVAAIVNAAVDPATPQ